MLPNAIAKITAGIVVEEKGNFRLAKNSEAASNTTAASKPTAGST
ncbi:MAG: hypothetical protein WDM76_16080 [Limisphaerales bacterium]